MWQHGLQRVPAPRSAAALPRQRSCKPQALVLNPSGSVPGLGRLHGLGEAASGQMRLSSDREGAQPRGQAHCTERLPAKGRGLQVAMDDCVIFGYLKSLQAEPPRRPLHGPAWPCLGQDVQRSLGRARGARLSAARHRTACQRH